MITSKGYASHNATAPLAPFSFERRDPGPSDVVIEILYCGVCHSDIHQARNEWGNAVYPMVPGHEIVGRVTSVGSAVTKFRAGDLAGVGCLVDSCGTCANCQAHEEQFCLTGATFTYNTPEKQTGGTTYGGYSNNIVTDEAFVLKISPKLDLAATAPLLCAGITTYSPLRHWKVGPGQKVGVVGLGGLGHMALKFARSFGAQVVQFTTSPNKIEDALRLGAHEVVVSKDEAILHIRLHGALEGLVDLRDRNHFDIRNDAMLRAVIQHLLRLPHPADQRARHGLAPKNQRRGMHRHRLRRHTHQHQLAVELQQRQQRIHVVIRRNGVQDEVERAGLRLHRRFVFRHHHLMRAQPQRILDLVG